jgi:homocysteine S-methyltransferase
MKTSVLHKTDTRFLAWTATHTDLVFNHGLDLPGMATFPLLETQDGRDIMRTVYRRQIEAAGSVGMGAMLVTPTFKASRQRAPEPYKADDAIANANARSVHFLKDLSLDYPDVPTLICGCIGPAGDAYAPESRSSIEQSKSAHSAQIEALAGAGVDLIGAYTFTSADDAVEAVHAAQELQKPIAVSFTVETDGCLPLGQNLVDVIEDVDRRTGQAVDHFMVNCAHPDHIRCALTGHDFGGRLLGVVVNASRKSHAELGRATELDAGDPEELGNDIAALCELIPDIRVVGGCCGTDARHLLDMARAVS